MYCCLSVTHSALQNPFEKRERAVPGTARPPSPLFQGFQPYRRRRSDFKFFWPAWILAAASLPNGPVLLCRHRDQSSRPRASHNARPHAAATGWGQIRVLGITYFPPSRAGMPGRHPIDCPLHILVVLLASGSQSVFIRIRGQTDFSRMDAWFEGKSAPFSPRHPAQTFSQKRPTDSANRLRLRQQPGGYNLARARNTLP